MEFKHIQMLAENRAQIVLYEDIGRGETATAKYVANEIDFLVRYGDVDEILVRINSRGGDMIEGFGIYSALQVAAEKGIKLITQNDGMAASMAVPIMLVAQERKMKDFAMMMIHDPWGSEEEVLIKFKEAVLKIFTGTTNLSKEKLGEMMTKETWLSAEEALELGLITEIIKTKGSVDNKFQNNPNASALIEVYNQVNNTKKTIKSEVNMKNIAISLGLPETATEAEINAAIVKMKATQKEVVKPSAHDKENIEVLLSLGRANGHIDDSNIEDFRTLATKDYATVYSLVGEPKAQEEEEEKTPNGQEPLTVKSYLDITKKLNGMEQPKAETKAEMFLRLSKHDVKELSRIGREEPKLFNEMQEAYKKSLKRKK